MINTLAYSNAELIIATKSIYMWHYHDRGWLRDRKNRHNNHLEEKTLDFIID
jgi:hypothetical protein